jgi:predicted nucleotidyltransferase
MFMVSLLYMEYLRTDNTETETKILEATIERCREVAVGPLAVLLHGSRANGNSYEGSDWDLYVLSDIAQEATGPLSHLLDGNFLDISRIPYLPEENPTDYTEEHFSAAMKFKVLWAKDETYKDFSDKVIKASKDRYLSERPTKDARKEFLLEVIFDRFTVRVGSCPDPLRRAVYISNFLDRVSRQDYWYFTNQWNHSISEGSEMLKKHEPELYSLLVKLPQVKESSEAQEIMSRIRAIFTELADKFPGTAQD